jgi:hypothetical protein
MNWNIDCASYANGTELRLNAKRLRDKLFPVPVKTPPAVAKQPKRADREADDHVRAWRRYERNKAATVSPIRRYLIARCEELGFDYMRVLAKQHDRQYVDIRRMLIWEVRVAFGTPYPRLADIFGGDHSTMVHHHKTFNASHCHWRIFDDVGGQR